MFAFPDVSHLREIPDRPALIGRPILVHGCPALFTQGAARNDADPSLSRRLHRFLIDRRSSEDAGTALSADPTFAFFPRGWCEKCRAGWLLSRSRHGFGRSPPRYAGAPLVRALRRDLPHVHLTDRAILVPERSLEQRSAVRRPKCQAHVRADCAAPAHFPANHGRARPPSPTVSKTARGDRRRGRIARDNAPQKE